MRRGISPLSFICERFLFKFEDWLGVFGPVLNGVQEASALLGRVESFGIDTLLNFSSQGE